jgi:mRNA-degrading endonuclease YafQ of YafQ-DinJ toxin-antitoxin module
MKASIVDLRRKAREVIRALERNESVTILYRGKRKGVIQPLSSEGAPTPKARDHPAFGMWKDHRAMGGTDKAMAQLRKGRTDAL